MVETDEIKLNSLNIPTLYFNLIANMTELNHSVTITSYYSVSKI